MNYTIYSSLSVAEFCSLKDRLEKLSFVIEDASKKYGKVTRKKRADDSNTLELRYRVDSFDKADPALEYDFGLSYIDHEKIFSWAGGVYQTGVSFEGHKYRFLSPVKADFDKIAAGIEDLLESVFTSFSTTTIQDMDRVSRVDKESLSPNFPLKDFIR